jgi:hypothetical protein
MFHDIEQTSMNRMKLNQEVRKFLVELAGSTNISTRQAGSHAMLDFVLRVFQRGLSFPKEYVGEVINAEELIDPITPQTISQGLATRAEEKFKSFLNELVDVKFVNLVVDAGTVHQLRSIVCLLSSPYVSAQPILLDLRENHGMTKPEYRELFCQLVDQAEEAHLTVCSIIIDNLGAQSAGLESFLVSPKCAIIHIKCFAHMTNLVIANTLQEANLSRVMAMVTQIQTAIRKPRAVAVIGKKCPVYVKTRWIYMIDTLAFIFDNLDVIWGYMFGNSGEFSGLDHIPTEVFELYAILLPFDCFLRAVEARCCSITSIIPLVRGLLEALRGVRSLLNTGVAKMILRDLHIRLLARLSVNNMNEALTAYALTKQGRNELRLKERGYSTQGPDCEVEYPKKNDLTNHMKGGSSYDDVIAALSQEIMNSEPFIGLECAPSVFDEIMGGHRDMEGHNPLITVNYKLALSHFVRMFDDDRFNVDIPLRLPSLSMYQLARSRILQLAVQVGSKLDLQLDMELIGATFDKWLFSHPDDIPFLFGRRSPTSVDDMWRIAHRHAGWEIMADLALRFISCGTSEADAERVLSMQRNIAGLHGTRFGIEGMRARMIGQRIPGSKPIVVEGENEAIVVFAEEEESNEVMPPEPDDSHVNTEGDEMED